MNKRGQVFLLGAIIIGLALVAVSVKYNTATEYKLLSDYEELSGNYLTEAPKVINYAKYENLDEGEKLKEFTKSYKEAASKKDPNFGIFYMYRDEDGTVRVLNTLNKRVLTIRVIDPETGTAVSSVESYGDIESVGSVCVSGLGCTEEVVAVENFGGIYAEELDIEPIGSGGIEVCLPICDEGEEGDECDEACAQPFGGILNILTNTEKPIEGGIFERSERALTAEGDPTGVSVQFTIEEFN